MAELVKFHCQFAGVTGTKKQTAAGGLDKFGKRPVSWLHHGYAVRPGFEKIQALRLAKSGWYGQDINLVEEAHFARQVRRFDVVEKVRQLPLLELAVQFLQICVLMCSQPARHTQ